MMTEEERNPKMACTCGATLEQFRAGTDACSKCAKFWAMQFAARMVGVLRDCPSDSRMDALALTSKVLIEAPEMLDGRVVVDE